MDSLTQTLNKLREKEKLGTLATAIWFIFLLYMLFDGQLNLLTYKTLLFLLPGLFVGALSMMIPYLILFRGFLKLNDKLRLSDNTLITYGYIKRIVEMIYAWNIAWLYFQLLESFV